MIKRIVPSSLIGLSACILLAVASFAANPSIQISSQIVDQIVPVQAAEAQNAEGKVTLAVSGMT